MGKAGDWGTGKSFSVIEATCFFKRLISSCNRMLSVSRSTYMSNMSAARSDFRDSMWTTLMLFS